MVRLMVREFVAQGCLRASAEPDACQFPASSALAGSLLVHGFTYSAEPAACQLPLAGSLLVHGFTMNLLLSQPWLLSYLSVHILSLVILMVTWLLSVTMVMTEFIAQECLCASAEPDACQLLPWQVHYLCLASLRSKAS